MSSNPPRRFKPELVETTTDSSKKRARFAPEPVETTRRHGGPKEETGQDKTDGTLAADSASGRPRRKFAPEPVETSSRHGGPAREEGDVDESTATSADATRPKRRFAPQPIETSSRHGGPKENEESKEEAGSTSVTAGKSGGRRRFAPEMVETATRSNRKKAPNTETDTSQQTEQKPARRKFAPQLIETASRSRKAGDTTPAVRLGDKTNAIPSGSNIPEPLPVPPVNSPSAEHPPRLRPIYGVQDTSEPTRQHSYRVPSLEAIESSESDKSGPPSLSESQSGDSNTSEEGHQDATRRRESLDDRFSGYLLALAARAAEKQLREQAAAAYPNFNQTEPVAHYVNVSGSEDDNIQDQSYGKVGPLRQDSEEEKWVLEEMKKHGEEVYNQAKGKGNALNFKGTDGNPKPDAWITRVTGRPPNTDIQESSAPKKVIGGRFQDLDLTQMRKAASPPMLGGDLEFPRCPSPEHARFDVTQRPEQLQKAINGNYQPEAETKGLWAGPKREERVNERLQDVEPEEKDDGMWKPPVEVAEPATGLWGGFCTADDTKFSRSTSGIATPVRTPAHEQDDPFSVLHMMPATNAPASVGRRSAQLSPTPSYTNLAMLSSSPPSSRSPPTARKKRDSFVQKANARLELESRLDSEFSDAFVTQVFNYLSLGYPALARKFDDELSRITGFEPGELQGDDQLAEGVGARGYIRLGEAEPSHTRMTTAKAAGMDTDTSLAEDDEVEVQEHMCVRWRALRKYVREWGRQMLTKERAHGPGGVGLDPHRAWGLPGRRGSWGL